MNHITIKLILTMTTCTASCIWAISEWNNRANTLHPNNLHLYQSFWSNCTLQGMQQHVTNCDELFCWFCVGRQHLKALSAFLFNNYKQLAVKQCVTFPQELDGFLAFDFSSTIQASYGNFVKQHISYSYIYFKIMFIAHKLKLGCALGGCGGWMGYKLKIPIPMKHCQTWHDIPM